MQTVIYTVLDYLTPKLESHCCGHVSEVSPFILGICSPEVLSDFGKFVYMGDALKAREVFSRRMRFLFYNKLIISRIIVRL